MSSGADVTINGVRLSTKNLISSDSLQVQLAMVLEVRALACGGCPFRPPPYPSPAHPLFCLPQVMQAHSTRFDDLNKKISNTASKIEEVHEKARQMAADMKTLSRKVDTIDGQRQAFEDRVAKQIHEIEVCGGGAWWWCGWCGVCAGARGQGREPDS